jgi:hypothetical protein
MVGLETGGDLAVLSRKSPIKNSIGFRAFRQPRARCEVRDIGMGIFMIAFIVALVFV